MPLNVAIFVDGDNISSRNATAILALARSYGQSNISRVYGNKNSLENWENCPGFSFIYSGSGKNAADLHLAIDAMEFSLRQRFDVALICSSDSDFIHLARRLRESGKTVIGFGNHIAAEKFKETYNKFHLAKTPTVNHCASNMVPVEKKPVIKNSLASDFDREIRDIIANSNEKGAEMSVADLNIAMRRASNTQISQKPEKTWRGYLTKRKTLYDLDPQGPNAKVRIISAGFKTPAE